MILKICNQCKKCNIRDMLEIAFPVTFLVSHYQNILKIIDTAKVINSPSLLPYLQVYLPKIKKHIFRSTVALPEKGN